MYQRHFGLQRDPFSIAPDPRYLFMSERHREALAHLLYGVSGPGAGTGGAGGGFVLLTGDIGTGKTTICRCFLEQIPAGCHVAYIFNPKLSVLELLQTVCDEFHIVVAATDARPASVKDYIDALNGFLLQSHADGQSCVLIIDEAQNLQADVLEQLRLLTNLETRERKLLQIVLIGQPELRTMLARPELEQLAQRVVARFHLDALSASETTQYIGHRLAVAGHTGPIPFDRAALRNIHRLARGVPRRINLLCGRALLGAWATGLDRVTGTVVARAATEVFGGPGERTLSLRSRHPAFLIGGLGLLAGGVIAGLGVSGLMQPQHQAAPTVGKAPSTPTPTPLSSARPMTRLEDLLTQLPGDTNAAWSELGTSWQLAVAASGAPCEAAAAQGLECYRGVKLTLPMLRQLGRPGIVSLRSADGALVYAVLVGLTEQTAAIRVAGRIHTVNLHALGRLWQGELHTYWRPPQAYAPQARGGSKPPFFQQLSHQLAQITGTPERSPAPLTLDAALQEQVQDFQRAHGLTADGRPGPMTLMQIEAALGGTTGPRLLTDWQ